MTTIAQVNKLLREKYGKTEEGKAKVKIRAGRGYYYFDCYVDDVSEVESLYVYRISHLTTQQVLDHVDFSLKGE